MVKSVSSEIPYNTVNLLYNNVFVLSQLEKFLLYVSYYLRYIVMVVEAAIVVIFVVHAMYDSTLLKLERKIETYVNYFKNNMAEESHIRYVLGLNGDLLKVDRERYSLYELNNKVLELVPSGVLVKSVSFSGKNVSLRGSGDSFLAVARLQENIRNSVFIAKESVYFNVTRKPQGEVEWEVNFKFE